eukprot:5312660-Amphidinium_carterae.2
MEGWSSADGAKLIKSGDLEAAPGRKEGQLEPKEQEGTEDSIGQKVGSVFHRTRGLAVTWHGPSCKFYNFSHRTVCLSCKASKGAGFQPAGEKQEQQRCEQGHTSELKEHLEAALAVVTQLLPRRQTRFRSKTQGPNSQTKAMETKWVRNQTDSARS